MGNITFVLFTYNEEKRISYAVRNFIKYGRVILLDGGSTDKTKEIAEKLGAEFLVRPPSNKPQVETQENFDFLKAHLKTDWIYWGYVDNIAPKSLVEKLVEISLQDKIKYVLVPLYTYLWGNVDNFIQKSYSPFFFHKDFVDFSGNYIHGMGKFLGSEDQLLKLPNKIEYALQHFSTYNISKFVKGHLRYAEAEAAEKFKAGKKFSVLRMFVGMGRYCWIYGKRGYKSGVLGLIIVLGYLFFRLMAYAKLYELENNINLETIENKYSEKKEKILQDFDLENPKYMKKSSIQTAIQKIREVTPLRIRQKIGPVISFILYVFNTRIRKNRKRPKVLSIKDTVSFVVDKKLSVIRFGDGEISLIDGLNLGFQKRDIELSNKLELILKSNKEGLLVCIPGLWERLEKFAKFAYWFNMHHLYRYGHVWKNLLSYEQTYGDTNITRSYLAYSDKSDCEFVFKKIFSIWEGKKVVLVEGEKSRLGLGNDMFDKTTYLKRILCPPENAFDKYEDIKKEVLKFDKDNLILVSLGPTAKVLAYDLFLLGYRVIDVGHVDMEYEMFLRGETQQTKVKFKYFNEINERTPEECTDEKYLNQVVVKVV